MLRRYYLPGLIACFSLLLAACGASSEPTATPRPSATPFPTFAFVAPTTPPILSDVTLTEEPADAIDPQMVERGLGRYEALECATCHGENGEGVEGEGPSLLEWSQTETEFIDFMRSGGELGADHQYSTDRLSENGGRNLYTYLTTLAEQSE